MRVAAAALLLLAAAPAGATQHLVSAPLLPITRLAWGPVTTGDFDGDGHRDVAYALNNPTGVAVLLGDGQGRYGEPLVSQLASQTSSSAEAIVADDFNADGRLDLALSDFATGPAVYLGLGDGRFAGQSLGGDTLNLGLASGDFDGDGRRDLALAHRGFTTVAQVLFYRGTASGTFAPPIVWSLPVLLFPYGVVARDFTGDGRDDLAVADNFGNQVAILVGSAALTPDLRGPFPAGDGALGIDAGDLDGDGRLDVVTADQRGRTVTVLRGTGPASLGPPLTLQAPGDVRRVRIGHFDADGRPDVIASGQGAWTYAGDGLGGLLPPRRYGVAGELALAELTGDGRLDAIVGPSLLAGDGAGAFAAQRTFPVPPGAQTGLAADFDRDGRVDVAVAHADGTLSILRGDGQGGLGPASSLLTGTNPVDLATGDFDRDGWPDLAVAHAGTQDVVVLRNDRVGGFTRRSYPVGGQPQSLALGDFGNDGIVDIAVANETAGAIVVLHGLPDGTFTPGGSTSVGSGSLSLVSGQFNADARADLAWFRAPFNTNLRLQVLAGTGGETFVAGPPVDLFTSEHALAAADLDADGRLDLVGGSDHQSSPQPGGLGVRLGDGLGGFGPAVSQPPIIVQSLVVRDFTQDGRPDVAAFESSTLATGIHLLEGRGDGTFGLFEATPIPVGGGGRVVFASDFDGDARPDVAALVSPGDTLTLLLGRGATAAGSDLAVAVEGTPDPAASGQPIQYVATVVNRGPLAAAAVRVRFRVPLGLAHVSHVPGLPLCGEDDGLVTCDLPALASGATFTLTVDTISDPSAGGRPRGWADARALAPEELAPADNFVAFTTEVNPVDLSVTLDDSADPVQPGRPFRYTLTVTNQGLFQASRVFATLSLPVGVTLAGLPPACVSSDDVNILCGMGSMFPQQVVSLDIDVAAGRFTSVSTEVEVDADQLDVDLADNRDLETTRMDLELQAELAHGSRLRLAPAPGAPAEASVLVRVGPRSAYEVVLDEVSGDLDGATLPVGLERLDADTSTILQAGAPAGTGHARTLRWQNTADAPRTQVIRVRSRGCSTDCGPDDVFRLRAYETAGSFARFNTTGDQQAVVLLQNPASTAVSGTLWLWNGGGALLASHSFALAARRSLVLNLATLAPGASGSITVTHDGGYGGLVGKAVAIEPSTGFSYDTPLIYRPR